MGSEAAPRPVIAEYQIQHVDGIGGGLLRNPSGMNPLATGIGPNLKV